MAPRANDERADDKRVALMGAITIALMLAALAWVLDRPRREVFILATGLWAVALVAALVPGLAGLNRVLGGTVQGWLVIGGLSVITAGYLWGLSRLKARIVPVELPQTQDFRPAEVDRYARHIMLSEIGGPGQQRLKSARVLVVGAGGLGSPALLYLAAAGVGTIGVIDDDRVEASNLQRQVIHTDDSIGTAKVFSAQAAMLALNPFITVQPYQRRLDGEIAKDLIAEYDLVLDGADNFDTRYLVNATCVALCKPLISGAITQWEGQFSLYHPAAGAPCYACVFPERPLPGMVPTCAQAGVAAPLPGIIGSMMAMEAVKWITGAGQGMVGRLMIHDALHGETRMIAVKWRHDCAVCAGQG